MARTQKKAVLEHRTLVLVDESGFYLLPGVVKTYAPCGNTPILRLYQTRDHLSVISGITPRGNLLTMVHKQAMTGIESVRFLKHLLHRVGTMLLVVWDGSPIHRGREVKGFLSNGGAKQIHLEQFPAYAPDLNPAEGVWNQLKFVEMRNLCCSDLIELHYELNLAIVRLRRKPELIQSFFTGSGLSL